MTPEKLLELAHEARERAYAPYSHYAVGAALLTKDGCYDFAAIAVVGGPAGKPVQAQDEPSGPCGVCRQVMQEFCGPDFEIHMQKAGGGVFTVKLPELLPFGFTKDSMEA